MADLHIMKVASHHTQWVSYRWGEGGVVQLGEGSDTLHEYWYTKVFNGVD